MLKLLIVDDEEIICNTIAKTIHWTELGIHLIGTCLDGVEAYHMILDESPDIVITDIRMPGISGLELIERISSTNSDTQFIILSGSGEFEFAKRAMKCGVRHYLLKPCDKEQIITCTQEAIKDFHSVQQNRKLDNHDNILFNQLRHTLTQNIISEGISLSYTEDSLFAPYERYLDFSGTPYQLCYIYFLEKQHLAGCLETISAYFNRHTPQLVLHKIYINNILLLFFANYSQDYSKMDTFLGSLSFPKQRTSIKYERVTYANFKSLLKILIQKLKRYDMLYFADEERLIPNFNYEPLITQSIELTPNLISPDTKIQKEALEKLERILSGILSRDFLLQLSTQVLIAISTHISAQTVAHLTDFLSLLQQTSDRQDIYAATIQKINELLTYINAYSASYSSFIGELLHYLDEHISDYNLTLKWIAENHLYMNVNYVSRCFVKETHQKFSSYLMNLRVEKAKEILKGNDKERIQHVAELVGCGNNPYYFNKIFKKCTGMTPSAYIRKSKSETAK